MARPRTTLTRCARARAWAFSVHPHAGPPATRAAALARALTFRTSRALQDDEWEYEQGLKDELADLSVADRAGGGGDGGGDDESAPRPEEIDEFGFSRDGYDYSKHLRESGGGMWVPASAPGERAAPAPSAGGEFVLREERESAAQVRRRRQRREEDGGCSGARLAPY